MRPPSWREGSRGGGEEDGDEEDGDDEAAGTASLPPEKGSRLGVRRRQGAVRPH